MSKSCETKIPHQAVVFQLTAVTQRRNNNKLYQETDSIVQKITIPQGQSERIDCRHIATQQVKAEVSIDFKQHTLLSSAHKHEQRDSANKTIVIVTDKYVSADNCPIKVGIVPINWLPKRYLLISQSAHCFYQNTNTNREKA